jgi:hypothetical protein
MQRLRNWPAFKAKKMRIIIGTHNIVGKGVLTANVGGMVMVIRRTIREIG